MDRDVAKIAEQGQPLIVRASLSKPFRVSSSWSVSPPSQRRFTSRANRGRLHFTEPLSVTSPSSSSPSVSNPTVASSQRKHRESYSWCSIPNSFRACLLRKLFSHRAFLVQLAVRAVGLLRTPKSPSHERSWHGFDAARTQNREACGGTVG